MKDPHPSWAEYPIPPAEINPILMPYPKGEIHLEAWEPRGLTPFLAVCTNRVCLPGCWDH